jgi:hypothetical protein
LDHFCGIRRTRPEPVDEERIRGWSGPIGNSPSREPKRKPTSKDRRKLAL